MRAFVRRWILRLAPEPVVRLAKRHHYLRQLRRMTDADEPELRVVRRLVREGDVALDVGANVGLYTRALSERVGPGGRVLAVEPIPETFATLRYCVEQLGLGNVSLFECAVSSEPGEATMEVPEWTSGGLNFYRSRIVGGAEQHEGALVRKVRVRTLDEIARGAGRVGFVKCDVEGHELPAILGARQLIERDRPSLMIELSSDPNDPGSDTAKLDAILSGLGYRSYFYDGRSLAPRDRDTRGVNFFYLTDEQRAALGEP